MIRAHLFAVLLTGVLLAATAYAQDHEVNPEPGRIPTATLERAPTLTTPEVDSNTPVVWDLIDGQTRMVMLTSWGGLVLRSEGRSLTDIELTRPVEWIDPPPGGLWIEAIVKDSDGVWYGYYHNEIENLVCEGTGLVLPRIGAAKSTDFGATWENLGLILEAPPNSEQCDTSNRFFVGGVGDFSVMLDPDRKDLYIFFSQYTGDASEQGVAIARMAWADRDDPRGRVSVWRDDVWLPAKWSDEFDEQGAVIGGHWEHERGTPLYPARRSWHEDGTDVYWGPSIHWNTYLEQFVLLLNRADSPAFGQAGAYVAFAPSLADPGSWTPPQLLREGGLWYPQVVGLEPGEGTDSLAGESARFFQGGESDHLIRFSRADLASEAARAR